jgi:hypothetical protein
MVAKVLLAKLPITCRTTAGALFLGTCCGRALRDSALSRKEKTSTLNRHVDRHAVLRSLQGCIFVRSCSCVFAVAVVAIMRT